jgi:hypothetical protein
VPAANYQDLARTAPPLSGSATVAAPAKQVLVQAAAQNGNSLQAAQELDRLAVPSKPKPEEEQLRGLAWARAASAAEVAKAAEYDSTPIVLQTASGVRFSNAGFSEDVEVIRETAPPPIEVKLEADNGKGNKPRTGGGGCCRCLTNLFVEVSLSIPVLEKINQLFDRMDSDNNGDVSRHEAAAYFKGKFGKISTGAMFNEVDVDHSDAISREEFIGFWKQVRKSGYTNADILDEVEEMLNGGFWVDWKDGRKTV